MTALRERRTAGRTMRTGTRVTMRGLELRLVAGLAAAAAVVLGASVQVRGWVDPLPAQHFAWEEVVGWSVLALVTGGITFAGRTRHPPLLAGGLVGSAALLGATPLQCVVIALAGALGGLRTTRAHALARLTASALLGWATPGVLAVAARGGTVEDTLPIGSVVALWALLALVLPLVESLGTHLVLPPVDRVDPVHMLVRRLEPQTVLAALAVLAALTFVAVDWVAGLIVLLPAAAARVGFAKHDEGRRAVAQTLAAMTALPEWVGIIDAGHTARVRGVAERVAVDLGLESRVRRDVVRTAELHELGHLEGGKVSDDRGRIARSGAAVLEQSGMHGRVVQILDATDPDRVMQSPDPDVELGAAIVAAACELDRMGPIPDVAEAATRVKVALGKARRSAGDYL